MTTDAPGLREAEITRLDDLIAGLEAAEDIDAAVHTTRKGIKRLRAHLRLAKDAIDPVAYRAEDNELRDTARLLAPARDSFVIGLTLDALESSAGWEAAAACVSSHHRTQIEELLAGTLDEARRRLDAVRQQWPAHSGPLDTAVVAAGLRRTYTRGRLDHQAVVATPQPGGFHGWRKRVKYLRYQLEAIAAGSVLVDPLLDLGETLGLEHDHTVFIDFVDDNIDMLPDRRDRYVLIDRAEARRDELRALALKTGAYEEEPQEFVAGVPAG